MLLKELFNESVDRGTGMFTMDDVTEVSKMSDVNAAKRLASDKVEKSGAKKENIAKAQSMIAKAKSAKQLAFSMSNFILAHIDPKLKVAK